MEVEELCNKYIYIYSHLPLPIILFEPFFSFAVYNWFLVIYCNMTVGEREREMMMIYTA